VIGAIKIHDDYSLVEVPEELSDRIVAALKSTKIRGNRVTVQAKPSR
jgi:ATP-dependent RNA helicase DeaD